MRKRPYPLQGSLDAFCLTGIAAGLFAAMPQYAGNFLFAAGGLLAAAAGGVGYATPRMLRRFNRIDEDSPEDFILPSDKPVQSGMNEKNSYLIGYTKDTNLPTRIPFELAMRHFALIGGSGVGKTTLGMFILYQQMCNGGGFLFIDAKIDVDTRDTLAYLARQVGREDDLIVINIDEPSQSNTYNPILDGDPDEVASRLLNLLPSSEDNPGSDFYRQSANHALVAIVAALKECGYRYHFGDLSILLQSGEAMEWLLHQTPDGKVKMALDVFLDKYRKMEKGGTVLDANRMKEVLGGMAGRLAMFAQGKFGSVFNTYTPELRLFEAIRQNKMVYFMLPTMGKDTAALNLGKMAVSDFRSAVARLQSLPKGMRPWPPFLAFLDEMGSYVMEGIARLFEQARSAHVGIIPGFQAMGNLGKVSPEFSDILMQNTWSKVFYRFGGADSAEAAADMIGMVKRLQYTLSTSAGAGDSAQMIQAAPQHSNSSSSGFGESWREIEEYRVTPAHLSGLGVGECVMTIARRVYHLRVPMLNTPVSNRGEGEVRGSSFVDEFSFVPRHNKISIPPNERPINLEKDYGRFMLGGGG